ncbi:MAG TPA: hypothetical protein VEX66_05975 [Microlunatus sp.]|nr:hypothetical protein [Microlunatus sp.]
MPTPSTPPSTDLTSSLRRAAPRDLQRVLLGCLATALALLCGLPVLGIGWLAAGQCTGEGFRCLGWFVYGMLAAALVAAMALTVIAWRLRLGWWFALLTIALVIAPLVLGDGSPNAGAALLGPGLAAWVSEPRTPDPATQDPLTLVPAPPSPARHWAPRVGAVLVVSIVIPVLGRVF